MLDIFLTKMTKKRPCYAFNNLTHLRAKPSSRKEETKTNE